MEVVEGPDSAAPAGIRVGVKQHAVAVELLSTCGVLHEHELIPSANRHFVERHQREGHLAVSVEAPHKKAVLVSAQEEIYPTFCRLESPFAKRRDLWQSAGQK